MEEFLYKTHEGNCIEIISRLPDKSVDLILTDPPYNASKGGINLPDNKTGGAYYKINEEWDKFVENSDYLEFTKRWVDAINRVLSDTGAVLICCSHHNISEIIISLKELNYKLLNIIVWKKSNAMPSITKRMLTHSTEFIVWFAKGKNWIFNYNSMKKYNYGKQLRDVWDFPSCQGIERIKGDNGRSAHPTQKPLKLFKRLIEMASKENQIILDPFIGSGTTAIASEELNRKWIGIDNNPKYIEIADKRIEDYRRQKRII